MTHFFSKSLSEKLQGVGCISESGYFLGWLEDPDKLEIICWDVEAYGTYPKTFCPAFSLLDLIGPSEQANQNVKFIIMQSKYPFERIGTIGFQVEGFRHALIDLHSMPEIEAYVDRSFKGD